MNYVLFGKNNTINLNVKIHHLGVVHQLTKMVN